MSDIATEKIIHALGGAYGAPPQIQGDTVTLDLPGGKTARLTAEPAGTGTFQINIYTGSLPTLIGSARNIPIDAIVPTLAELLKDEKPTAPTAPVGIWAIITKVPERGPSIF
jgi:hypothetical protein